MSLLFLGTVLSFWGKDHIKKWIDQGKNQLLTAEELLYNSNIKKSVISESILSKTESTSSMSSMTLFSTVSDESKTFSRIKISDVLYFYNFYCNDNVYCSILVNTKTREMTCEFTEDYIPDNTYSDICKYIIKSIVKNSIVNKSTTFNIMKNDSIMSNYFGSKGYSKFKGPYLFYYCNVHILLQ